MIDLASFKVLMGVSATRGSPSAASSIPTYRAYAVLILPKATRLATSCQVIPFSSLFFKSYFQGLKTVYYLVSKFSRCD